MSTISKGGKTMKAISTIIIFCLLIGGALSAQTKQMSAAQKKSLDAQAAELAAQQAQNEPVSYKSVFTQKPRPASGASINAQRAQVPDHLGDDDANLKQADIDLIKASPASTGINARKAHDPSVVQLPVEPEPDPKLNTPLANPEPGKLRSPVQDDPQPAGTPSERAGNFRNMNGSEQQPSGVEKPSK
jgi:hypothetical protein